GLRVVGGGLEGGVGIHGHVVDGYHDVVVAKGVGDFFFFRAEDGIRDYKVTGVQTCALPICEAQFRNAFLMGCAGAWTLHPSQVAIAKRVFSPDVAEVKFALKILAAMPDGTGAVMIDGKMQDDATWKQAKVVVDLAKIVAGKDGEMGERYGV